MTSGKVTITSKNQITLPTKYVRKMQLAKHRILDVKVRGNTLILTPQPTLHDTMRQFWTKHNAKQPLTDGEIKAAVRHSAVARIVKD